MHKSFSVETASIHSSSATRMKLASCSSNQILSSVFVSGSERRTHYAIRGSVRRSNPQTTHATEGLSSSAGQRVLRISYSSAQGLNYLGHLSITISIHFSILLVLFQFIPVLAAVRSLPLHSNSCCCAALFLYTNHYNLPTF
jgi:hypothetical protein